MGSRNADSVPAGHVRRRCLRVSGIWIIGLLLGGLGASSALAAATPSARFTRPAETSAEAGEGHQILRWEGAGAASGALLIYQLEQAFAADFEGARTIYEGPDAGTFVSGLPRGVTHYRVRARADGTGWGDWSTPLRLEVIYPSSSRVRWLTGLGAGLLATLLGLVWTGSRRTAGSD